jgi:hypothetical protein
MSARKLKSDPFVAYEYEESVAQEQVLANAALLTVLLGLSCGVMVTLPLWSNDTDARSGFPLVPILVDWSAVIPDAVFDCLPLLVIALSAALALSLARDMRTRVKGRPLLALIVLLVFLVVGDYSRLQPWIYQYAWSLLVALLLRRDATAQLDVLHAIIACVIFWAGFHKFTPSFAAVLTYTSRPLTDLLGINPDAVAALAPVAAFAETLMGVMLWFEQTRFVGAVLGIGMFSFLLCMLGPLGLNVNEAIWPWNVVMISLLGLVFAWRKQRPTSVVHRLRRTSRANMPIVLVVALFFAVAPAFHLVGTWDSYMSFSLYTGNSPHERVTVSPELLAHFPDLQAFSWNENETGRSGVSVFNWSFAAIRAPIYLERRVFLRAYRQLCAKARHDDDLQFSVWSWQPMLVAGDGNEPQKGNCASFRD